MWTMVQCHTKWHKSNFSIRIRPRNEPNCLKLNAIWKCTVLIEILLYEFYLNSLHWLGSSTHRRTQIMIEINGCLKWNKKKIVHKHTYTHRETYRILRRKSIQGHYTDFCFIVMCTTEHFYTDRWCLSLHSIPHQLPLVSIMTMLFFIDQKRQPPMCVHSFVHFTQNIFTNQMNSAEFICMLLFFVCQQFKRTTILPYKTVVLLLFFSTRPARHTTPITYTLCANIEMQNDMNCTPIVHLNWCFSWQ